MTRDTSVAVAILAILLLAHLVASAQDQEPAEGAAFTEPTPTDNPAAQKRRT